MAIDTNLYSKNEFRFAIAGESVLGTAETTQTNFLEIYITDTPK